jgi:hypothetical protein
MSTQAQANPWARKASSNEGGDFELPPSGSHPAVLVGLVDLGTTDSDYGGKVSERHKVLLAWELTAEADSKGRNFIVVRDFTFSLNVKAQLRSFVEGWSGRAMADDEEWDALSLLGQACVVSLTEGMSRAGKPFVEVASASKPMRGLTVPPRTVEPFAWTFGDWDPRTEPPIPDWMPMLYGRKVADDVKKSKEWNKLSPF